MGMTGFGRLSRRRRDTAHVQYAKDGGETGAEGANACVRVGRRREAHIGLVGHHGLDEGYSLTNTNRNTIFKKYRACFQLASLLASAHRPITALITAIGRSTHKGLIRHANEMGQI